jgi:hypothetical protein
MEEKSYDEAAVYAWWNVDNDDGKYAIEIDVYDYDGETFKTTYKVDQCVKLDYINIREVNRLGRAIMKKLGYMTGWNDISAGIGRLRNEKFNNFFNDSDAQYITI